MYMIEGGWSGYHSGQAHVAHREYTSDKRLIKAVEKLGVISFTDGTSLYLTVTDVGGKKPFPAKDGYRSLIRDCISAGVNSVAALMARAKGAAAS